MERKISIQLYTVRDLLEESFAGTVECLSKMGYAGVESFQNKFGGLAPGELRALLDSLGLEMSGSHANLALLREQAHQLIAYNAAAGCGHLICARGDYQSLDDVLRAAEFFAKVAEDCKEAGLRFSYHNHGHEFVQYDGKPVLEHLLENAPGMGLELDVYWAAKAGVDPVAFQRKWAARSPLLHCKDLAGDAEGSFAEVGSGVLDFPAILDAASCATWLVVEQDRSGNPMESARKSLSYLKGIV